MASQAPQSGDDTARGLRWIGWSPSGFLGLDVAMAASLLLLTPPFLDAVANRTPRFVAESWLSNLSLALGILGVVAGAVYVIGFSDVFGAGERHGPDHARYVRQSLVYLCVTAGLILGGDLVPSFTGPFLGVPGISLSLPAWSLADSVIIPGLRALFAVLALIYAVGELASDAQRFRLLLAIVLGAAGAVAWPGIIAAAVPSGGPPEGPVTALVAGIVAGLGTSVISLVLFTRTVRELRRRLEGVRQLAS
ncbi:MAG: hypothetical protein WC985_03340 [Thermoplasmata archaeon]